MSATGRTTVVDSGSLEFTLDYEQTKHFAVGEAVRSDVFSAGGHNWSIKCFSHGWDTANNGQYVSISFHLMSKSRNVSAMYEALVVGRHGKPSSVPAARSRVRVFGGKDNQTSWGWAMFVKRADLEAKCVIQGRVKFLCIVLVMRDNPIPVPPPNIGNQLCKLRDGVLAARSLVFRAKFFGSNAEATSSNMLLDDIDPATFQVLLDFMYTDALPGDGGLGHSPPVEMFQHLLAAADRYALRRLKLMCAQKSWVNISLDSIATTLASAEMYSCLELKTKCIDFLVSDQNFKKVALTEGFLLLGQKFPLLIAELRERVDA